MKRPLALKHLFFLRLVLDEEHALRVAVGFMLAYGLLCERRWVERMTESESQTITCVLQRAFLLDVARADA